MTAIGSKSPQSKTTPHDSDIQVDLLRRENARLTSENNNLHKRLIASADAHDQHARKTTMVIRKLEQELQDLRFLNSQYASTIQQEQRRLDEERRRVSDLLKKWQIHGASRGSSSLPSVAQRIDLPSGPLAPVDPAALLHSSAVISSPHVVDMVKLAELNAAEQRNRADDADVRIHELELYVKELKSQVSTREAEIQRLASLMESDRQPDGSTRREHLETQIDYLQQALREAETQLHVANSRSSAELKAAQDKNARLIDNLRNLQQQLESLQSSFHDQSSIVALHEEVESLQELLKTSRVENQGLQDRIAAMEHQIQQQEQPQQKQQSVLETERHQQSSPAPDPLPTQPPEPHLSSPAATSGAQTATNPQHSDHTPVSQSVSGTDHSEHRLLAELQQERSARALLLEELRHLDAMTQSLSQQVERVLEERDNFESLYLQLVEKSAGDGTMISAATESQQPKSQCQSCAFLHNELQSRTNELKQSRAEVDGAAARVQELEDQVSRTRLDRQRFDDLQQRNSALQEAHMELTRSLGEQMRIIQHLNDDLANARAKVVGTERVLQVEAENQGLREELVRVQALSASSQAALNQRVTEVSQLHRRMQELEQENKNLSLEVGNIAADLSSLIKENQRLCEDIEQSRKASSSLESVVTNLQQALQQHRDLLRRSDHEKQHLAVNYKKLAAQHNARGDALTALQVAASQLRQEVRLKDARIACLSAVDKAESCSEPMTHDADRKSSNPETPHLREVVDGSLTREWLSIQREVAEDPSVLRRKRALEAAGT
ncbi:hypothetical protein BCR44DRAFT_1443103 [Catenaria anguillulae PL171]|uniref:Uncharacterized protein n=1 Tax=Catenaria anguillulae PL171 TaxID=765915 RepID=A0A1Y2H9B7_9FUNG|nr:hypothetical protein BCR44DRAFT_1443103 [Catenaria anguillulae PL171]